MATKKTNLPTLKIVSGGQTGADRAALDFAIKRGIPHGGWCPKGRRAEDGPIIAKYQLQDKEGTAWIERDVLGAGAGHLEPGRQSRPGGLRAGSANDAHQSSGKPCPECRQPVIR